MVERVDQLPDVLIDAKLVQDTKAMRDETYTGSYLGCNVGVCFENKVVDSILLEHIGKGQTRYAATSNNDLEVLSILHLEAIWCR